MKKQKRCRNWLKNKKLRKRFLNTFFTAVLFLMIATVLWVGSSLYNSFLTTSIPSEGETGIIQMINDNGYTGVIIKDSDNSAIYFEDPSLPSHGIDMADWVRFDILTPSPTTELAINIVVP